MPGNFAAVKRGLAPLRCLFLVMLLGLPLSAAADPDAQNALAMAGLYACAATISSLGCPFLCQSG